MTGEKRKRTEEPPSAPPAKKRKVGFSENSSAGSACAECNKTSLPGAAWPFLPKNDDCKDALKEEKTACKGYAPHGKNDVCGNLSNLMPPDYVPDGEEGRDEYLKKRKEYYDKLALKTAGDDCMSTRRCLLSPYNPKSGEMGCCPGQTGHHLIEASCFFDKGRGGKESTPQPGCEDYNARHAPCVCVEGTNNTTASHGLMHTYQGSAAIKQQDENGKLTYAQSRKIGLDALDKVFSESKCNQKCIGAQLDKYHKEDLGITDETKLRASPSGRTGDDDVQAANKALLAKKTALKKDPDCDTTTW